MIHHLKQFGQASVVLALLWGGGGVTRAGTITDPAMKVLDDEFSTAITQGIAFAPNATGGGVFGFFNGTGQTITELTFQTLIATNLSPADISAAFVCNEGPDNPFFQHCFIDYIGATGQLSIAFSGTNPIPPNLGPSDLVGLQMGIPPLLPGCLNTPDLIWCTGIGHFAISLSNSFSLSDPVGGWGNPANPTLFNPGQPVFFATEIQTGLGAQPTYPTLTETPAPEPATAGLMAVGVAAVSWIGFRRRRRAAAPGVANRS